MNTLESIEKAIESISKIKCILFYKLLKATHKLIQLVSLVKKEQQKFMGFEHGRERVSMSEIAWKKSETDLQNEQAFRVEVWQLPMVMPLCSLRNNKRKHDSVRH